MLDCKLQIGCTLVLLFLNRLEYRHGELRQAHTEMATGFAALIEERDESTGGHPRGEGVRRMTEHGPQRMIAKDEKGQPPRTERLAFKKKEEEERIRPRGDDYSAAAFLPVR